VLSCRPAPGHGVHITSQLQIDAAPMSGPQAHVGPSDQPVKSSLHASPHHAAANPSHTSDRTAVPATVQGMEDRPATASSHALSSPGPSGSFAAAAIVATAAARSLPSTGSDRASIAQPARQATSQGTRQQQGKPLLPASALPASPSMAVQLNLADLIKKPAKAKSGRQQQPMPSDAVKPAYKNPVPQQAASQLTGRRAVAQQEESERDTAVLKQFAERKLHVKQRRQLPRKLLQSKQVRNLPLSRPLQHRHSCQRLSRGPCVKLSVRLRGLLGTQQMKQLLQPRQQLIFRQLARLQVTSRQLRRLQKPRQRLTTRQLRRLQKPRQRVTTRQLRRLQKPRQRLTTRQLRRLQKPRQQPT